MFVLYDHENWLVTLKEEAVLTENDLHNFFSNSMTYVNSYNFILQKIMKTNEKVKSDIFVSAGLLRSEFYVKE